MYCLPPSPQLNVCSEVRQLTTIRPDECHTGGHLLKFSGHRQVPDAYLVALARHDNGRLATFDKGLAATHGSVIHLLAG